MSGLAAPNVGVNPGAAIIDNVKGKEQVKNELSALRFKDLLDSAVIPAYLKTR